MMLPVYRLAGSRCLLIKGMDGAIAAKHVTYDFARLMKQEGEAGVVEVKCSQFGNEIISKM